MVKALLQRGTLHLVTPRDLWAFAVARRELGANYWPPAYERELPERKLAELARSLAQRLCASPLPWAELRALLEPHATSRVSPAFLWRRLQGYETFVHVPPSGTWGYSGDGVYAAAEGTAPKPAEAVKQLIRRYLAAFGPATVQDVGQWAGLQRTGPLAEAIAGLDLRTFEDEGGETLVDLPRAPLPDPETPAPPRLVPRFDDLVLSHADRTRILGDVPPSRIVSKNALVQATILVDGLVVGTWQLEQGRVRLEPFDRLAREAQAALAEEAERIKALVA